jgi:uncharacterized protein (TIGR02466 family)
VKLFSTEIYHKPLAPASRTKSLNRELIDEVYKIRESDVAGQSWSKKNYPGGYTSYSSMCELFRVSSTFHKLKEMIDAHVLKYARLLDMDVKNHPLEMTHLWVNMNSQHVYHGSHIHPLSSISGTYYVQVPPDSGDIKFEDPRLSHFMGSVPRTAKARRENQRFVALKPAAGQVVLFESWLRHEVTQNQSRGERVSLSFNYNWF